MVPMGFSPVRSRAHRRATTRPMCPINREWVRNDPRLTPARKAEFTEKFRCQLRSAAWVDDQIAKVLNTLDASGEAENTYVVFWNDNGLKLGEHRQGHKESPYIEDTRFPSWCAALASRKARREQHS